jgi:hypothetical protein
LKQITTPPFDSVDLDLDLYNNYKESGYNWRYEQEFQCEASQEPPVLLREPEDENPMDIDLAEHIDALNDWLGLDKESDDSVNQLIAEHAGLSNKGKGKQNERQVSNICTEHLLTTLQCPNRSTSNQEKEESLDSNIEYGSIMLFISLLPLISPSLSRLLPFMDHPSVHQ